MSQRFVLIILCFAVALSLCDTPPATGPQLSVAVSGAGQIELSWPSSAQDFTLEQSSSLGDPNSWGAFPENAIVQGDQYSVTVAGNGNAQFFRLHRLPAPAFGIAGVTPDDGALDVGVTSRPRVSFTKPVDPTTLNANNFFASFSGTKIPAAIVPATDGTFAWLFFKQSLPGGARVQLTVDGSSIHAAAGNTLLDADNDGSAGGVLNSEFTTVSLSSLPGTSLSGIVVDPGPDFIPRTDDDLDPGADGQKGTADDVFRLPIAGVEVHLIGQEDQRVFTGEDGRFHFDAVPVGDVKIVINGNSAPNSPPGFYFPEMVIDAQMILGKENWTMTNGAEVYLPRLSRAILQGINPSVTNVIQATPDGAQNLSAFERAQLSIEIAPNSLIGGDGQPLSFGQVGISTVPSDVVRDMLPPGVLQHTFDITVQAPGIATFATPAPMSFPNVFNAAPGTKLNFLSFDHTTGRLEIEGTATVSADGSSVRTDPGTGVTHPGWHGLTPPGGPNNPPCNPAAPHDVFVPAVAQSTGLQDQFSAVDGKTFTFTFKNATSLIATNQNPCDPVNLRGTPLVIEFTIDGNAAAFLDGVPAQPIQLEAGQDRAVQIKFTDLMADPNTRRNSEEDALFGILLHVNGHNLGKDDHLIDKDIFIYRLLDVADLNPNDATLDFPDALVDGTGQVLRVRPINLNVPASATPQLEAALTTDFSTRSTPLSVVFDPGTEGSSFGAVRCLTPAGNVAGTFDVRGVGTAANRIFLDKPGLVALLKQIAERTTPTAAVKPLYLSHSEIDLLSTDSQRNQLADAIEARVAQKFLALSAGIQVSDFAGPNTITIRWTVNNEALLYGTSQPGGVGDGIDNDKAIKNALNLRNSLSHSAENFALSKTVNRNFTTTLEVYPENVLKSTLDVPLALTFEQLANVLGKTAAHEVAHTLGGVHTAQTKIDMTHSTNEIQIIDLGTLGPLETFRLSFDGLATDPLPADTSAGAVQTALILLDNVAAGNVAVTGGNRSFNVEFIGDYRGVDVPELEVLARPGAGAKVIPFIEGRSPVPVDVEITTPGGDAGRSDIMCGGFLDYLGQLDFQPSLALDILKLALRLDWSPDEAQSALETYVRCSGANLFDGFSPDTGLRFPFEGPRVAVFAANGHLAHPALNFGTVASDGTGGQSIVLPCQVVNFGNGDLHIREISIQDRSASFKITSPNSDLTVPQGKSAPITLVFDPSATGQLQASLRIDSDDPTFTQPIDLVGIGQSPAADLRVELSNNNVGPAPVGGQPLQRPHFATLHNIGSRPLVITSIQTPGAGMDFAIGGLPPSFPAQPLTLEAGQTQAVGLVFAPSTIGLIRDEIVVVSNDPDTPSYRTPIVGTGLAGSGDPLDSLDYGKDFVAFETPDLVNSPVLRGKSDASGNFSFFLPPDQRFHLTIFDPVSGLVSHLTGITAPSGRRTELGLPVFLASIAQDSDGDGLPDDVEFAIGTDPNKIDTDGDGVSDYDEVLQGLDPLTGTTAVTGIIGITPLLDAREVVVFESGAKRIAAVAGGQAGIALVDVTDPTRPLLQNVLNLQAVAVDVAVDPVRQIAVVAAQPLAASGPGIYFIDISDPTSPRLTQTLSNAATQVEIFGGYAYVSSGDRLRAINLETGIVEQELSTVGAWMAREANYLYVSDEGTLQIVDISGQQMRLRGAIRAGVPQRMDKLFVAEGIAYASSLGSYLTLDVSDPDNPRLISPSQAPQGGGIIASAVGVTASSLAVVVGRDLPPPPSPPTSAADIFNATNPTNTFSFAGRFPTGLQGSPNAVVIASGLAFIAHGPSGLAILNYLPFDTAGIAPSVQIQQVLPASNLVERSTFIVRSRVRDDVEVRNAELLLNGQVVQRSISFPFEFTAVAPALTNGRTNFTIQVRATDIGGNVGSSAPLVLALRPDAPPSVAIQTVAGVDPNSGTAQVTEGEFFSITSTVADDTRVTGVELLINGQSVAQTSQLPFSVSGTAPNILGGPRSFTVQLRATDTAGLTAVTAPLTVTLLPDTTPPVLIQTDPADGGTGSRDTESISLVFSELLAPGSLNPANFELRTPSGGTIRPGGFDLQNSGKEVDLRVPALSPGDYQLTLHRANITDRAGNPLGDSDQIIKFKVLTYSISWNRMINGQWVGGDWFEPANWLPARIPKSNDWVLIDVPATNVIIGMSTPHIANTAQDSIEPVHIRDLVSNRQLVLFYIDLQVDNAIQVDNLLELDGSKISNSRIIAKPDTILTHGEQCCSSSVTAEAYFAAFDNVTMEGDFKLGSLGNAGPFNIVHTLTLHGSIDGAWKPDRRSTFQFFDNATITGEGTLHGFQINLEPLEFQFPGGARHQVPITVILDTNITLRGEMTVYIEKSGGTLINRGTIISELPTDAPTLRYNSSINLISPSFFNDPNTKATNLFINEGSIEVRNSNRLFIQGSTLDTLFVNRGSFMVRSNSFLWLEAAVSPGKLVCEPGAICKIEGMLTTEPGEISELSGAAAWLASSVTFDGGTVRMTDGALLEGSPTFHNVTFEGELHNYDFNQGSERANFYPAYVTGYAASIGISSNATLNGRIVFHTTTNWPGSLVFSSGVFNVATPVTLNGNATIEFQGANPHNSIYYSIAGEIILGPGITIHGSALQIGNTDLAFVSYALLYNQGTITTAPGDTLALMCSAVTNAGVIHISSGTIVTNYGPYIQTGDGRLEFDLAGANLGVTYGQFQINSDASLDGTLRVIPIAPFQPAKGAGFQLMTYGSQSGAFKDIQAPPVPGATWTPHYNPKDFTLQLE